MNPILRNILAVIAGLVLGSLVNGGLIMISPFVVPLPEGVEPMDVKFIKENIHLFQPKHFIMPFLAHALGTLIGAFVAVKLAASRYMLLTWIVGGFFLIGGIMNILDLGGPLWFKITDLSLAYFPFALLGYALGRKR